MGVVIRQSFKSTIAAYIGVAIGAFNLLWLFPKFLSKEEIGLMRVVLDVALVFAALAQIGTTNISDRFFSFFKDEEKKHQGFFLLLLVYPLAGFFLISIVYLSLQDLWIKAYEEHSALLLEYIIEILPLAFLIMYMNILEAYCRVHFRIVVPGIVREVFLRICQSVIVILYFLKFITLDGLINLIILSYFIAVILLFSYIKNLNKLFINRGKVFRDKKLLKEMVTFGLFIFLGGASGMLATKIDIIMLSFMKDIGNAGVYTIAFFIGTIIEVPRRMISQIATPLISQAWKNNDLSSLRQVYQKTSLNQFIIGAFLFLLIWMNVDDILNLIPNSQTYIEGKYVILIIGLGRLADMVTGVNTEIILNSPHYKFNFILIIFSAFLLIALNYFLIPVFGMNGAALSILIILAGSNIVKYLFLLLKFRMQPFSVQTFYILLLGLTTYLIVYFIPLTGGGVFFSFLNIAIRSALIFILFGGSVMYFRLSADMDQMVKNLVLRFKK
jgi:O-antigen/teichoic acid export membrane protein